MEVIGGADAALDAQVIYLGWKILDDLGLGSKVDLQINNIGCLECRKEYMEELKNFYFDKQRSLCEDCKGRVEKNPLRLMDCKEEDCQILAKLAPQFKNYCCEECKDHYEKVKEFLEELEIKYTENSTLVRGLDYYTRTVFEFWDSSEGAQNSLLAGGRYDNLVELMGGPETPAVGFAAGVERIISRMQEEGIEAPCKDRIQVFVAQLGFEAKKRALSLLQKLRDEGIQAVGAVGKGSMRTQLSMADKFKAKYTLIMGEVEVREDICIVRDMSVGSQEIVPYDKVLEIVKQRVGEEVLDFVKEEELPPQKRRN